MKHIKCTCVGFVLVLQTIVGRPQYGFINSKPMQFSVVYDSLTPQQKADMPARDEFDEVIAQANHQFIKFNYNSDTALVEAYLVKPKNTMGKKYPVIIYNRGGTGNFGKIKLFELAEFYSFLKEGFIVAACNYRYINNAAERDEWGGKDFEDVVNLLTLVKTLPYADSNNVFMCGSSRGGYMTYLSQLYGLRVNAIACTSAPTDLPMLFSYRPDFAEGWHEQGDDFNGLKNIWGVAFDSIALTRSAINFAGKFTAPCLILHSINDDAVAVQHALLLAQQLAAYKKKFKLIIFDDDEHGIFINRSARLHETVLWFKKFINPVKNN